MASKKKVRKLPATFFEGNTADATRTQSVETASSNGKQLGAAFAAKSVAGDPVAAAEATALDNARRAGAAARRSVAAKKVADALAMAQNTARTRRGRDRPIAGCGHCHRRRGAEGPAAERACPRSKCACPAVASTRSTVLVSRCPSATTRSTATCTATR